MITPTEPSGLISLFQPSHHTVDDDSNGAMADQTIIVPTEQGSVLFRSNPWLV